MKMVKNHSTLFTSLTFSESLHYNMSCTHPFILARMYTVLEAGCKCSRVPLNFVSTKALLYIYIYIYVTVKLSFVTVTILDV
jgi:hypothetical protein